MMNLSLAGSLLALGAGLFMMFHALAPMLHARYAHANASLRGDIVAPPPTPIWRLTRYPVRLLSYLIGPFCPSSVLAHTRKQLKAAGMDQSLSAVDFLAGRLLVGIGLLLALYLLASWSLVPWIAAPVGGLLGCWLPGARVKDQIKRRRASVLRDLPVFLDLVTLAVQGGMTIASAIALAVDRGPHGALRGELVRALREIRTGRTRLVALRAIAERLEVAGLTHAIAAIVAADRQGADLSLVLRSQAQQRRQERFLEAERQAMRAPVKMLFPLVVFIFPGTFLVLLFPIALQIIESGVL